MFIVFIFRRDLRVADNHGLSECYQAARKAGLSILPIYIYNPVQVDAAANPYYSRRCVDFMKQSLNDLHVSLPQLHLYEGADLDVLQDISGLGKKKFAGVFFNADITPYARERDAHIASWCSSRGIRCCPCYGDYCLVDPTKMEKPYQKFTPFYRKYRDSIEVALSRPPPSTAYYQEKLVGRYGKVERKVERKVEGGRKQALGIVKKILRGEFGMYDRTRDDIALLDGTTRLSAYLKFGCVSVREVFKAVEHVHGREHALIRQLFWRAFYDQVTYHFPRVLGGQVGLGNSSLREKYDRIEWTGDNSAFVAWSSGITGIPLIDAGMRQLAVTGYMHNRLRMIVASFLVKSLHVDWRKGECFFARSLIDYHPSANSGGWQWASGGGADSQQYNRAFSPWLQAKRYDPDCIYIKRYVPELRNVPARMILNWERESSVTKIDGYPAPMVSHSAEVKKSNEWYGMALYHDEGKVFGGRKEKGNQLSTNPAQKISTKTKSQQKCRAVAKKITLSFRPQ